MVSGADRKDGCRVAQASWWQLSSTRSGQIEFVGCLIADLPSYVGHHVSTLRREGRIPISTIARGTKDRRDHHARYRVALREAPELIRMIAESSSRVFVGLAIVSRLGGERSLELHAWLSGVRKLDAGERERLSDCLEVRGWQPLRANFEFGDGTL
jgi:hypothetical protein